LIVNSELLCPFIIHHLHTYCVGNHCLQSVVMQTVHWLRPKLLQSLSSFCSTSTQHRLHANCLVNLYQYHQNLRIVHRLFPERHVDNIVLIIRVLYAGMVRNLYMHIFWKSNVIVCELIIYSCASKYGICICQEFY
jgi:hypothetical protein